MLHRERTRCWIELGERHGLIIIHYQEDPGTLLLEVSAEEVSRLVQVIRQFLEHAVLVEAVRGTVHILSGAFDDFHVRLPCVWLEERF